MNRLFPIILAAFSAFVMGATLGWSSPVQPQLQQNSTLNKVTDQNSTWYMDLNDDQMSWVGSLINIGASVGAICGGYLMDRFGRAFILKAVSVPYFIGWLFIILAVDPCKQKEPLNYNTVIFNDNNDLNLMDI